jgi:hypothetical protein
MLEVLRALLMASPTALRPVDVVAACRALQLAHSPQQLHDLLLEAEQEGLVRLIGAPDAQLEDGEIVTTGLQAELTTEGRAKIESGYGGQL